MKSFFYLQRSDRRAVIVLLAGLVLLVVVLHFVGGGNEYTEVVEADSTAVKKQIANKKTTCETVKRE